MELQLTLIVIAGVAVFFKELLAKCCWAFALYLNRGEFSEDGDDRTPDHFLLQNPHIGTFTHCTIRRYSLMGVYWCFLLEGKVVEKKSNWLDWASFRNHRFSAPKNKEESDCYYGEIEIS